MVMLAEPLLRALDHIAAERGAPCAVLHFTPTGRRIDQAVVQRHAHGQGAVLLCGRYEGIDQRLVDARVTEELSLGDFVLSGGELPALALLDAVARLQDGVLTAPSHQQDSFSDGLLEGPQYSRPEVLMLDGREQAVPVVLLSGHHGQIARWRREQSLALTARRRPELIEAARAQGRLTVADERFLERYLATPGL
jgi:tRNA (guanine37-N1)-methyltransferase